MSLSKIFIRVAPLSNRIVLGRFGKDPDVALETKDATSEFLQALVQFAFGKMPEKEEETTLSFGGGDEQFTLTIKRKNDESGSDTRPAECRFRLKDEGKAYPKSGCAACGKSIVTGLGTFCSGDKG